VPSAREMQAGAIAAATTLIIVSSVLMAGRVIFHAPRGGWGAAAYVQPTRTSNP
jgi:hypothetical protein